MMSLTSKPSHVALPICIVLAATTLIAYWPALNAQFVTLDDDYYVLDNPQVNAGPTVESIAWAFTTTSTNNWHPLTWISHMLDCRLYGVNPMGHHLTGVLVHTANVLLLFAALYALTGMVWRSMVVAALFAVHPLHVESVAWVSERKDVLSTLFWMLTLLAYVAYARTSGRGRYALVLVLFALGLMAKPMLVSLPLVLLVLDWWPLKRLQSKECGKVNWRRLLLEKMPLFALAAASCAVTYWIHAAAPMVSRVGELPLSVRVDNTLVSYAGYLGKMLWPVGLAVQYPHPTNTLPISQIAGSVALLAALTLFAVAVRKRRPYVLAGWLWYLFTLLPVIGLVQTGEQGMADRYTYIPLIGVFISLVWAVSEVVKTAGARAVIGATAGVAIASLAVCTRIQSGYWHDSVSLFERALKVTRGNYVAHLNLGFALEQEGDTDRAKQQYLAALRLQPEYPRALYNYGTLLGKEGDLKGAANYYRRALRAWPGFLEAHYNLGATYDAMRNVPAAIREYEIALRLAPKHAAAHNNLAILLYETGQYAKAWNHVRAAQACGLCPHPGFLQALSERMPQPDGE